MMIPQPDHDVFSIRYGTNRKPDSGPACCPKQLMESAGKRPSDNEPAEKKIRRRSHTEQQRGGSALAGFHAKPTSRNGEIVFSFGSRADILVVSARQNVVGPVQLDGYLSVMCAWDCQLECCVVVWRAASGLSCWQITGGRGGSCHVVMGLCSLHMGLVDCQRSDLPGGLS